MLFFVIFSVLIVMPVASQLNFITVVTTGFLINVIELGTFKSFGVLLLSIADSLEATNATLGFTISLCMSIGYIFGKMSCFLWIISSGIHRNVRVQVFIVANSKEETYNPDSFGIRSDGCFSQWCMTADPVDPMTSRDVDDGVVWISWSYRWLSLLAPYLVRRRVLVRFAADPPYGFSYPSGVPDAVVCENITVNEVVFLSITACSVKVKSKSPSSFKDDRFHQHKICRRWGIMEFHKLRLLHCQWRRVCLL